MPQKAELIARKLKEVLHLGEEVDGKEILVQ